MKINDKKLMVAVATVLALVLIVAVVGIVSTSRHTVVLQGYVECEQITISGKLTGRIEQLVAREGDTVRTGDTLVIINCPEAYAKLRQADGMEQAAGYQQSKLDDGTRRQVVETARQLWRKTQAELQLALTTRNRVESLWRDSIVPTQRRDEVEALLAAARANEVAAREQYEMARQGAQRQDLESAHSLVEAARGVVDEVTSLLRDIHLTAPAAGQVAEVYPSVGELVGAGAPLMSIVILEDAHVVLNVREDYLTHFAMGSRFKGDVPALGLQSVEFQVYYISPLGSYATWHSSLRAGDYNLRTFEIHARPLSPHITPLRPGMSVIVKI